MKAWAWRTATIGIVTMLVLTSCGIPIGRATEGEQPAPGGDVAGNGGDIVICEEPRGTTTYRMLDLYEGMQAVPPLDPELGSASYQVLEKVNYALDRLSRLDAARANYYRGQAQKFFDQVEWITSGKPLADIPDSGDVKLPSHCRLAQIAIRRPTFHQSVKPFLIDKRLWDASEFDDDQKAALVLHEIVYGELIQLGHKNSINARLFNRYLCSNSFEKMNAIEYSRLTQRVFTYVIKPEFLKEKIDITIPVGITTLQLRPLLRPGVKGNLSWTILPEVEWIHLDATQEILILTPPGSAVGTTTSVSLIVRQDDGGAIAQLNIRVEG